MAYRVSSAIRARHFEKAYGCLGRANLSTTVSGQNELTWAGSADARRLSSMAYDQGHSSGTVKVSPTESQAGHASVFANALPASLCVGGRGVRRVKTVPRQVRRLCPQTAWNRLCRKDLFRSGLSGTASQSGPFTRRAWLRPVPLPAACSVPATGADDAPRVTGVSRTTLVASSADGKPAASR
jgi:hypothetical protein